MTAPTTAPPRIDPDPLSPLNRMQRYLVHEFVEDYQDGLLSRRDLMTKIGHIAGGAAAAAAILTWFGVPTGEVSAQEASPAATPIPPQSQFSVAEGDPAVSTTEITFQSGGVAYTGYEARPAGSAVATPSASPAAAAVAGQSASCWSATRIGGSRSTSET
jgi:carboxymethylenebutenolidase